MISSFNHLLRMLVRSSSHPPAVWSEVAAPGSCRRGGGRPISGGRGPGGIWVCFHGSKSHFVLHICAVKRYRPFFQSKFRIVHARTYRWISIVQGYHEGCMSCHSAFYLPSIIDEPWHESCLDGIKGTERKFGMMKLLFYNEHH